MTQMYEAAMYYVEELGCSVIPIKEGAKCPAIAWKQFQSRRPHQTELVDWFHQADHQIGVVCGTISGNLEVLDFETPEEYAGWASRHRDLAGTTRTVQTGKGVHVYYRRPDTPPGNRKLKPGLVETRGEGGMVLAPPSLHPSGKRYRLRGSVREITRTTWEEVSRGEDWDKKKRVVPVKVAATVAFGRGEGDRNNSLFDAALLLRDTSTPKSQALAVLFRSNENNDPPLPKQEIRHAVDSAYSRPARRGEDIAMHTLTEMMQQIAQLREEQAKGWLRNASDPDAPEQNFTAQVRQLFFEAGTLNEMQIQSVLDEVMRNPPLAPRKQTELLRIWRRAHKRVREAIAGKATDDEIAAAYKAQYEDKRIYSRDRWYQWKDTGVWEPGADASDEIWQTMIEFKEVDVRPSSQRRRSIEECLCGQSFLGIPDSALDDHPEWINLLNCILDLHTRERLTHNPTQYLTTQLPFEYDPDARCPRWNRFLREVLVTTEKEPDEALITFMQQAFGYSLTAWTKYEMSFWLQGNGANGKSTLIRILRALSGSGAMALNLGILERDQYQLALLPGIRVATCTESPVGMKVADSIVKTLVSGDARNVRLPYGKPFQLIPQCKIWWAMNNYPRVADASEGFWRKVKVIPFYASFEGAARNEDLFDDLLLELPGIFNWALAGLDNLVSEGWARAEAVEDATAAYRRSNDVEQAFVDDVCLVGENLQVTAQALYAAYKQWCFDTGHRHKTKTRVSADWLRLGFHRERTGYQRMYRGVGLKLEQPPPPVEF